MKYIISSNIHSVKELHGVMQAAGATNVKSSSNMNHIVCDMDDQTVNRVRENPNVIVSAPRKVSAA